MPSGQVFFLVRGDLNVDAFDYGILPEKPINHSSGLDYLNEVLRDDLGLVAFRGCQ